MMPDAMIELNGLKRRFGPVQAVRGVDLRVGRGELLGLLGPNGAGKTTTMRMVAGLLEPSAGQIRIAGKEMTDAPEAAARLIGYLPEGGALYEDMTPEALLHFVGRMRGMGKSQREASILRLSDRIGLREVLKRPIHELSKGYRRRVGLAQAMLHDPPILLLDEPTEGLDPNQRRDVRRLLQELAETTTILLSTHLLEEVDAIASRVVIIAQGRLAFDGTPAALKQKKVPGEKAGDTGLERLERVFRHVTRDA